MELPSTPDKSKKGLIKIFNFEADFSKLTHLIKAGAIKLKLFSDNKKIENHLHIDNSKHLTLNITQLDQSGKQHLKEILNELKEDGCTLLEDKSNKTLESIQIEEKTSATQKFLTFFKDKVSPQDLEIIRGALYIKSLFDKGEGSLELVKAGIRQKYGQRGNNIVNLCSAKYFENYFIPYYEHLEKTETDKQEILRKFAGLFDILATELPFTVFVNHGMTVEEVVKQTGSRFEYGAEYVNIHGIGEHNVSTIKDAIEEIRKNYGEENISVSVDEEKKHVMKARIEFRRKSSQDPS